MALDIIPSNLVTIIYKYFASYNSYCLVKEEFLDDIINHNTFFRIFDGRCGIVQFDTSKFIVGSKRAHLKNKCVRCGRSCTSFYTISNFLDNNCQLCNKNDKCRIIKHWMNWNIRDVKVCQICFGVIDKKIYPETTVFY